MNIMSKLSTVEDIKNLIADYEYEDVVIFENPSYANAFLGISDCNRAIYDYDLMVESLMEEYGITDMEAIEFIEYNTIRSLPYYENAPIILYSLR